MQDSPIQVGPISLQGFEIPSFVRFGGQQKLAIHKLSGGRRVVERLGPDDDDIAFQGTFSGGDAEARARRFNDLRLSGEIVWLTWESFRRRVVVKKFIAEYHSPWWIPYKAWCAVVHQDGVSTKRSSTALSALYTDLSSALSAVAGSSISLASLQTALSSANVLITGTLDQTQAAAAVQTSVTAINNEITNQSTLLLTSAETDTPPSRLGQVLANSVSSAGLLATAVTARSYVGRIGSTLAGLGQ